MITLTDDEKRIVFQLEGCRRYDAVQEIAVLCRYTRDYDIKATAENLLKKLRELSEDDCRELICDIQRNYHLPWKARTVGEMIAVARQESGARKLEGHDIMALERFDPEVTHMIVFDVLSGESSIGDKGDRMRLFLTEAGYKKGVGEPGQVFYTDPEPCKSGTGAFAV